MLQWKLSRVRLVVIITGLFLSSTLVAILPNATHALSGSEFRAGEIISDAHFFDGYSLNESEVQAFLNAKVPNCRSGYTCLKSYQQDTATKPADAYCSRYEGGVKTSARIITDVSKACGVSPKVMLILLQKEQTLVTDTWPESIQYRSATGYGCPDSAACDADYYGFFNQVYQAARQYKVYAANKTSYNYRALRNNNIYFQADNRNTPQNEQTACGYTSVYISNQATAGLYIYTPYQPNKAALDNLYGLGDGCSAYGNRNFWRIFNDWFGTSQSESFMKVVSDDPGDTRQWVVYSGVKQYIPDPSIIYAWGLEDVPLTTLPASQLAAVTTGPNLDRVMKHKGGGYLYIVDSGKRYRVAVTPMVDIWGLGNRTVSTVSAGLFMTPADGGDLKPYVKPDQSSTVYMVDSRSGSQTYVRPYANTDVFLAREGSDAVPQNISTALFNSFTVGPSVSGTKVSYGGSVYQLYNSMRLWQTSNISSIYSGVADEITLASLSRFIVGSNVTQLIKSPTSPVYLLDNGVRYPIASGEVLNSWITGPSQQITLVNNNFLNLIPNGAELSSYVAENSSQRYLINQRKVALPSQYWQNYSQLGQPFQASNQLLDLYSQSGTLNEFVRGNDSNVIYHIGSEGVRRAVNDKDMYLASGYATATEVSYYIVRALTEAGALARYVTDGTQKYLLDQGKKWTVSDQMITEWNLNAPQSISSSALGSFVSGGALSNKVKDKDGVYYLIVNKKAYATVDSSIAGLWGIGNPPTMSSLLPYKIVPVEMLTRFATSSDGKKYAIDKGNWYEVSESPLVNLGGASHPLTHIESSSAPNAITQWNGVLVKNDANIIYVLDEGRKRRVPSGEIANLWTNSGSIQPMLVSDNFLSFFANASDATRSFKGGGPGVFTINNGKKQLLNSSNINNYTPYFISSEALINSIPTE